VPVPGIHVFLVKIHHEDTENTKVPKRTAIFVPFVSSWFPIRTVLKTWMTGTSPVKGIWWGELREWMALGRVDGIG
jgi:hypothetical protein